MYKLESTNLQMKIAEQINDSSPPKRTKVTDSPPDTPSLKTRKTIHKITLEKEPPLNVIIIDIMSASASVQITSIASGTTTSISNVTNTADIK